MTDDTGTALPPRSALSRRKHLCKNWWNDEWLKREIAIVQHLANGDDTISFGTGDEEVRFSSRFESFNVGFGINEEKLAKQRTQEEQRYIDTTDNDDDARVNGNDESKDADAIDE